MKISIRCEGCGNRFEVDASNAGRRGRCKKCGQTLTVPKAPTTEPTPSEATDSDHLDTFALVESSAYAFSPAAIDPGASPAQIRTRRASKKSPSPEAAGAAVRDALVKWRTALIVMGIAGVVLLIVATVFPVVRTGVGIVVAGAGVLLFLYGFASAAYIAFTEDFLYGFFFVVFPIYAAYYFVSRWEDMQSRLAMVVAGLVLMSVGAWILEIDHTRGGARDDDPDIEARAPADPVLAPCPLGLRPVCRDQLL